MVDVIEGSRAWPRIGVPQRGLVEGIVASFDQMTARAQAAGALRHDVRGADVRTLTTGCAQRLVETGQQDEGSRRLFTELILNALRP